MDRIYDTESDNIKCNFCTNYFRVSLHFANMQRYAVKVCPKCFNAFRFTVAHPATHKLHKLVLFDTGLALPQLRSSH